MARIPASSMYVDAKAPSDFAMDDHGMSDELDVIQGNVFSGENVDGIFRGKPGGLALLAVTNKRLMYHDDFTFDDRSAIMSVPLKGVSSVGFVAGPEENIKTTSTVGIAVAGGKHLLICRSEEEARQLHDMLIWAIT